MHFYNIHYQLRNSILIGTKMHEVRPFGLAKIMFRRKLYSGESQASPAASGGRRILLARFFLLFIHIMLLLRCRSFWSCASLLQCILVSVLHYYIWCSLLDYQNELLLFCLFIHFPYFFFSSSFRDFLYPNSRRIRKIYSRIDKHITLAV